LRVDHLKKMVDVIAHRGPDDAGYLTRRAQSPRGKLRAFRAFADTKFQSTSPSLPLIDTPDGERLLHSDTWNLFLGHRRLSIIDLSSKGHQPMGDDTGTVWLSYNGEVYNFLELREELEKLGHRLKSRTDTEVILHAYLEWGIDAVDRFNGMFAFALWDERRQALYLARDRCGIKPLYYHLGDNELVFASEIKSILAYLPEKPKVDLPALNEYFSFQNVLSDRTLFEGIRLLPPAHILEIHSPSGETRSRQYWDFDFTQRSDVSGDELRDRLLCLIQQAVQRQCVSDVPIGSYLSGGMDSGSITAIAAKHLGRICTFTGGFDISEAAEHELRFDERDLAEKMASAFQTEHYECVIHAGDIEAVMDDLVWHLEDLRVGQCYPNYYIARLAGKFVKVVLSGTGGDELFGGYPWRYAAAVSPTHSDYIQNYYRYWKRLVPNRDKLEFFNADVVNTLKDMNIAGAVPFRNHTISVFRNVFAKDIEAVSVKDQVNHSLYFECKTFLHGVLLVEDKLSMAHSLETRVPLLDNELIDFACRVPVNLKVTGIDHLEKLDENLLRKKERYEEEMCTGKDILRSTMEGILPGDIVKARKQGFSAPDESWFRGRSQRYVRDRLLAPDSPIGDYVSTGFRERVLAEHSGGAMNRRLLIWSMLCFDTWLRRFL